MATDAKDTKNANYTKVFCKHTEHRKERESQKTTTGKDVPTQSVG